MKENLSFLFLQLIGLRLPVMTYDFLKGVPALSFEPLLMDRMSQFAGMGILFCYLDKFLN